MASCVRNICTKIIEICYLVLKLQFENVGDAFWDTVYVCLSRGLRFSDWKVKAYGTTIDVNVNHGRGNVQIKRSKDKIKV